MLTWWSRSKPFKDQGVSDGMNATPSYSSPVPRHEAATDCELGAVVAVWSDLPPAIRAGIVAMVKAATPTRPSGEPATKTMYARGNLHH